MEWAGAGDRTTRHSTPTHQPCLTPTSLHHTSSHQKFDPDNSKTLSLDEYIRTCLFLQTGARTFAAFDPNRTGTITTNFSQFMYCCSHVR
jgi:hypothetical protein